MCSFGGSQPGEFHCSVGCSACKDISDNHDLLTDFTCQPLPTHLPPTGSSRVLPPQSDMRINFDWN